MPTPIRKVPAVRLAVAEKHIDQELREIVGSMHTMPTI
jgi:hypothetical protein